MDAVREEVITLFLDAIDRECVALCQKLSVSRFRLIPVEELQQFKWTYLVEELQSRSPLLLRLLTATVGRSDNRNQSKAGAAHNPGICAAVAVILKERNREMCGLQSEVSLLMFSCHCEKKVEIKINNK